MFCREDAGLFARRLCWLARSWNPVCPKFLLDCILGFFIVRVADFRASAYRTNIEDLLCSQVVLCKVFSLLD